MRWRRIFDIVDGKSRWSEKWGDDLWGGRRRVREKRKKSRVGESAYPLECSQDKKKKGKNKSIQQAKHDHHFMC
jgi:hypothetical protein